MPSFRSSSQQAESVVSKAVAFGSGEGSSIESVGTARNYESAMRSLSAWAKESGNLAHLSDLTARDTAAYLADRSEVVSQSTLDRDRQAIEACLGHQHDRADFIASREATEKATESRAYTALQVEAIASKQSPEHSLSTHLASAAGLRAHELHTIRPATEQPASGHREWSDARFAGKEGELYTVVGKGGLIREVMVPSHLAEKLEATRLAEPREVTDRGVKYEAHYDLKGGQAWSQSFTEASKGTIGESHGAHGLRHGFAQDRMADLQRAGYTYKDALGVVSQELGHFRESITEVYLR